MMTQMIKYRWRQMNSTHVHKNVCFCLQDSLYRASLVFFFCVKCMLLSPSFSCLKILFMKFTSPSLELCGHENQSNLGVRSKKNRCCLSISKIRSLIWMEFPRKDIISQIKRWPSSYFNGKHKDMSVSLHLQISEFVWVPIHPLL